MSIPTVSTDYVARAKALLTSMFNGRRVISGILKAYVTQLQLLENAIWVVLNQRSLDTNYDVVLDMIGNIVGEARAGRSNDAYRAALRIRILVNRSNGRTVEVVRILRLAANGTPYRYRDYFPAGFEIEAEDPNIYAALVKLARDCKPLGVSVDAVLTTGGASLIQRYGSSTGAVVGETVWPSSTDSTIPYVAASVETI